MKGVLITSVLCICFCGVGLAQQSPNDAPATKADVEKYLEAIHAHEMIAQMAQAMSGPMHKMIHEEFMKDQDRLPPDFEAQMNKIMDNMMTSVPWDEMIQNMIPAYEKHFSKGEMDALTAFYSSPVGQKILRELPAVTAESMENMMPILRKYVDDLTQRIQDEMAQVLNQKGKGTATKQN